MREEIWLWVGIHYQSMRVREGECLVDRLVLRVTYGVELIRLVLDSMMCRFSFTIDVFLIIMLDLTKLSILTKMM
jgi:hypothetical protein